VEFEGTQVTTQTQESEEEMGNSPTEDVGISLVETGCYNCGSSGHTPYAAENGFCLVKCTACGLLYVTPRPDENQISRAHECGIHQGQSELDMTGVFNKPAVSGYSSALKDLYGNELQASARRWLDIGCGHGEFLVALEKFSHGQVCARGIEPNQHKQRSARARGLEVSYFDLRTHKEQYDVVSLLNVYSHLPNPPEFLRVCKSLLKPGGELLLETGDTADLPGEEHPRPFLLPDHLSFASERIVLGILQRCGFRVVALRKYPAFPFRCGVSRWLKEVVKLAWPGKQSQLGMLVEEYRRSRRYVTDMYVRLVLTGEPENRPVGGLNREVGDKVQSIRAPRSK
jgi:SAM-dependent methyltransferase